MAPETFVPIVEETGLVGPVGEQVLEGACRQAKKWEQQQRSTPPLVLSVNVSARQLQRPCLAKTVKKILEKSELEASYLNLDMTETVYIRAAESDTAALNELKP